MEVAPAYPVIGDEELPQVAGEPLDAVGGGRTPITALGRTVLLVDDADAAVAFYCDVLGFHVLLDRTADGYRVLHLGLPDQDGVGFWLMPVLSEQDRALVGRQCGGYPLLVLYTDDLDAVRARLHSRQVRTWDERDDPDSRSLHLADLYGNVIIIAELHDRHA